MATLLRSAYFSVRHHLASSYVQVIRTEEPFPRVELVEQEFTECERVLSLLDAAASGILLDFRRAPMSTDSAIHRALVAGGDRLIMPFARSALLVATRVGAMQSDRVARAYSKVRLRTFHDEDEAVRFVTGHS